MTAIGDSAHDPGHGLGRALRRCAQMTRLGRRVLAQSRPWSPRPSRCRRNVQTVAAGTEEMGGIDPRDRRRTPARLPGSPRRPWWSPSPPTRRWPSSASPRPRSATSIKVITLDRRADEPAGAERHHRGGPRRRGRQGLRRRGQRGQGAGPGDGQGDRGHRPPRRRPSRPTPTAAVEAIGQIAAIIAQINDIQTHDRRRGRGADRHDQRDRPQRRRGGQRVDARSPRTSPGSPGRRPRRQLLRRPPARPPTSWPGWRRRCRSWSAGSATEGGHQAPDDHDLVRLDAVREEPATASG